MGVKQIIAVVVVSTLLGGTVHAQMAPVSPTTPSPLRAAISRQHDPLRAAASNRPRSAAGQRRSVATKATAGAALGFAGAMAGMLAAFGIANAVRMPGDGRTAIYTGALIGGGTGTAVGIWLASR